MRVESFETQGFGKLTGRTSFSPGLNVIVGDNEAGKSTMLAALLLGLIGRPKRRGRAVDGFERYRPWNGSAATPFRVKLTLSLDDGSRLELSQDLDEPSRSKVLDLDLGRDLTSELLVDRAPDASLLLELDRSVVARSLVVRQSELAAVRDDPQAIQSMLQRAATRGAPDATANEALARIEAFRRERIGTEHASSTRPLKRALEAERTARRACDEARQSVESLRDLAERARRMREQAHRLRAECRRSRRLAREHEREDVAARLEALDSLESRLAALPVLEHEPEADPNMTGDGDLEPASTVQAAERRASLAAESRTGHERARPLRPATPAIAGTSHALRALAEILEAPSPTAPNIAPGPVAQIGPWPYLVFVLAGIGAGLGIGLGHWAVVAASVLIGLLAAIWVQQRRRRRDLQAQANAEVEASWRRHRADLVHDQARRDAAARELIASGVEADPISARRAATSLEAHGDALRMWRTWSEEADRLARAATEASAELRAMLTARGASTFEAYVQSCATRRERAERARRRREAEEGRATLVASRESLLRGQTRATLESRLETLATELDTEPAHDAEIAESSADLRDPDQLEVDAAEYEQTAARIEGELVALRARAPSITEAEEALDRAKTELARVRKLDRHLELAMDYLRQARDAVHRDIAPRLSAALSEVVPRLTLGHYHAARVGADNLEVSVRDTEGEWRSASQLSQGTADQLHLALRVILAQTLCKPDEPPPLLFDEVTAHADPNRRSEIIAWLAELAERHQIIVFTSDPAVAAELVRLGASDIALSTACGGTLNSIAVGGVTPRPFRGAA